MERIASIIFYSVILTIMVGSAFAVSPFMGWAMVAFLIYFSVFR